MMALPPLAQNELSEKAAATLERVAEALGGVVPAPFHVHARNDAFAHDFYMNFRKFVFTDGKLSAKA